ncbi:hypothetical protein OG689_36895 [Kitasatospora sp. NBC_00240]|uniref:hypothetical protein n=1 Tax=Kitasatospora sp. NBC_00240 TaxID=2903567 RepID=UPI0022561701|nr:hypothetical protein [Kitasatospora sp. NBC_00240]MCX5214774.1 hypothetical protein [Kitasatospora sp. NBC_00240]
MSMNPSQPDAGRRKLPLVVLGLAALVATMLCAFALPSIHGGPHRVPVGVTGSQQVVEDLRRSTDSKAWDVRLYSDPAALRSAIEERDVAGGLSVTAHGVDVYTATAGGPSATGALTTLGSKVAAQHGTRASVQDLVPFTEDDPRGGGLTAVLLPLIFGGIFPALILSSLFPGHRGLRTRLSGGLLFSVVAGAAVAAVLRFATHSINGDYWLTALGLILGMAALSSTLIGLQAFIGIIGFAAGSALMMLLGNPLSGLTTGPHWLPEGWAAFGQLLPPGASGSLLRANGFFGGAGAGLPALVLTAWAVFGVALVLLADRRGQRAMSVRREILSV